MKSGIIVRIKRDGQVGISKYKARLFVRENFQTDASDYAALFFPVAFIELIRLMLAIPVSKGYSIDPLDMNGAFLHATLPESENIWICFLKIAGVSSADGLLVRLVKSLYGLR